MSHSSPLLIRADAGPEIGTGHLMRCIALAQQWLAADNGPVTLVSSVLPDSLKKRAVDERIQVVCLNARIGSDEDLRKTVESANRLDAEWIVLDGYSFNARYQHALKNCGRRVLLLNDSSTADSRSADIILNQNIYATPETYAHCEVNTRLLLGSRYALLRNEFNAWRDWRREVRPKAEHVLITLGGADVTEHVEQLLVALNEYRDLRLQVKVVSSPAAHCMERLSEAAEKSFHFVEVIQDPRDMAALMAWADLLISAAGSTTLEALYMGLPSIIGVLAENQVPVAKALVRLKAAVSLGRYATMQPGDMAMVLSDLVQDKEARELLAASGRVLVDGDGGRRIVKHMMAPDVTLRLAVWADRYQLWQWANQPRARRHSFSQDEINWDEHLRWFTEQLEDDSARLYVGMVGDEAVGLVRYALEAERAVVSVNVSEPYQGRGLGPVLIAAGSAAIESEGRVPHIEAYVKRENEASLRAFTIAGFEQSGELIIGGQRAWRLSKRLDHRGRRLSRRTGMNENGLSISESAEASSP